MERTLAHSLGAMVVPVLEKERREAKAEAVWGAASAGKSVRRVREADDKARAGPGAATKAEGKSVRVARRGQFREAVLSMGDEKQKMRLLQRKSMGRGEEEVQRLAGGGAEGD